MIFLSKMTKSGLNPCAENARFDAIYRRIDDVFIDPLAFVLTQYLGIPGLIAVLAKGNVAIANAPGSGVADDKVIYAFVPKIIEYYLSEQPLIQNVKPSYAKIR
ncbi:hypothetical protein ALON55S_04937 [Alishewanella longhuensis]